MDSVKFNNFNNSTACVPRQLGCLYESTWGLGRFILGQCLFGLDRCIIRTMRSALGSYPQGLNLCRWQYG
jgi:hypothetical protein